MSKTNFMEPATNQSYYLVRKSRYFYIYEHIFLSRTWSRREIFTPQLIVVPVVGVRNHAESTGFVWGIKAPWIQNTYRNTILHKFVSDRSIMSRYAADGHNTSRQTFFEVREWQVVACTAKDSVYLKPSNNRVKTTFRYWCSIAKGLPRRAGKRQHTTSIPCCRRNRSIANIYMSACDDGNKTWRLQAFFLWQNAFLLWNYSD